MIGQGKPCCLSNEEVREINFLLQNYNSSPLKSCTATVYHKALIKGSYYFAEENKRVKKRNSYTILRFLHAVQVMDSLKSFLPLTVSILY